MSVRDVVNERGISELLHFTTNRGLTGMLATEHLQSRRRVKDDGYLKNILHPNSVVRPEESELFDKAEDWLDYVNLSISAINSRFFRFSRGWEHNKELWWSILSFDAEIMSHPGVYFATTNNAYEHCRRAPDVAGLNSLFATNIARKSNWRAYRGNRPAHLPTCEQAELLYPGEVSFNFLRRIYVREGVECDRARGWLRDFGRDGVDVVIAPEVFQGFPN